MLDGSLIATMSEEPARFTGMTWCFSAVAFGMSFSTSSSTSKSASEIAGTPYCFERKLVRSVSAMAPCFTSRDPMRPPVLRCSSWAFWSCCREMRFSRTSSSPSRPDMWGSSSTQRGRSRGAPGRKPRDLNRRLSRGSRNELAGSAGIAKGNCSAGLHSPAPRATVPGSRDGRQELPCPRGVARDLIAQGVDRREAPLVSQPRDEREPDGDAVEVATVEAEEVRLGHDARVRLHGGLHTHVADAVVRRPALEAARAGPPAHERAHRVDAVRGEERGRLDVRGREAEPTAAPRAARDDAVEVVRTREEERGGLDVPLE